MGLEFGEGGEFAPAAYAQAAAEGIARELTALSINTDFAPDTDVNSEPANPVIGVRSFSDSPDSSSFSCTPNT